MSAQLWVLGVGLIILGSVGNNLGNNLVSLAHKQKRDYDDKKAKDQKALGNDVEANNPPQAQAGSSKKSEEPHELDAEEKKHRNLRLLGTAIFVIGNLSTFAAFGFAAQSLLASLESIQFLSNIFFIKYVHKEVVTWRMLISTASIIGGNTLVVIYSDHAADLLTSRSIIYLYLKNTPYHAYLCIAGVLWAVNHYTFRTYHVARTEHKRSLWKHSFMEPFTFAVSSAIIGTQAVLNSKCMSMLIQVSARGELNEFERPTLWVILVTWLLLVSYWVRRLDLGLALFPPLFIIPVMQVFFVFFAILCGGIYFEEFIGFSYEQYVGFIVGVLMILGGVYGLAPPDVSVIPMEVEHEVARRLSVDKAIIENEVKAAVRKLSVLALANNGGGYDHPNDHTHNNHGNYNYIGSSARVAAEVVNAHQQDRSHSIDSRASLDMKTKPETTVVLAAGQSSSQSGPRGGGGGGAGYAVVTANDNNDYSNHKHNEERKSYHQLNSSMDYSQTDDKSSSSPAKANRKVVKRYPSSGIDQGAGSGTSSTTNLLAVGTGGGGGERGGVRGGGGARVAVEGGASVSPSALAQRQS